MCNVYSVCVRGVIDCYLLVLFESGVQQQWHFGGDEREEMDGEHVIVVIVCLCVCLVFFVLTLNLETSGFRGGNTSII